METKVLVLEEAHLLAYASGSSTNKLTFSLAIGANNATNSGDILSFGANPLRLNSGTIVDRAEGGNATITSAFNRNCIGTITVCIIGNYYEIIQEIH